MKKIILFILITLCISCTKFKEANDHSKFVRKTGTELLITKGYSDILITGTWPKNDQNLNARTYFQAKDKDSNIVEGYFIEIDGKISTYIEKKDIKL